ncbi:helix-turn-helix transcriptional regulator [Croceicoccus sp. Ery5]|uniref:ArsR/SmtB family transcription factor n=1 Tax=Croceicoccus sp. Ery5 TaxID=1703340 RepID=UPI001E3D71A6|nr:metalloregulator ArsR/SmtB family transcription factor [Croceicoccus sp. Ery5]
MNDRPPIDALKAIAHPVRFKLLEALKTGERNVGEIEEATGISQPALSQQLAVLRNAGLVETRKEAKLVYYSHDGAALSVIAAVLAGLAGRDLAKREGTVERDALAGRTRRTPTPGVANFARLD